MDRSSLTIILYVDQTRRDVRFHRNRIPRPFLGTVGETNPANYQFQVNFQSHTNPVAIYRNDDRVRTRLY